MYGESYYPNRKHRNGSILPGPKNTLLRITRPMSFSPAPAATCNGIKCSSRGCAALPHPFGWAVSHFVNVIPLSVPTCKVQAFTSHLSNSSAAAVVATPLGFPRTPKIPKLWIKNPDPMIKTFSSLNGASLLPSSTWNAGSSELLSDTWTTGMFAFGNITIKGTKTPWSHPRFVSLAQFSPSKCTIRSASDGDPGAGYWSW